MVSSNASTHQIQPHCEKNTLRSETKLPSITAIIKHVNMSVFFSLSILVLLIGYAVARIEPNHGANLGVTANGPPAMRVMKKCRWPGDMILAGHSKPNEENFDKWLGKVRPGAFKKWMKCTKPLSRESSLKKLRMLKKEFKKSEGAKEIIDQSNCRKSEIFALFNPNASAKQAMKAISCIQGVIDQPTAPIPISVRFNAECERNKRNMINRAKNILLATVVAVTASGVCCAFPITAVGWCPVFAAALAAELVAIAELKSARDFECPACSNEPTTRLFSKHMDSTFPKQFVTFAPLHAYEGYAPQN